MRHIKPKRWISICGIGIAVTTAIIVATMTGSCVFGSTTDFCEQFGLRCKEGQECAAHQPVCIDIGGCGNGVVDRDKGEICDDGNIVDGEVISGVFVADSCSHNCMSDQTCGNKQIDMATGETCDDGDRNGLPEDGCDINCHLKIAFCGNGIVDINMANMTINEQCDPGDMDSAGCNSNQANMLANLFNPDPSKPLNPDLVAGCKFSRCGDGYTNAEAGEQCDSRGQITPNCNGPLCTLPSCGDNFHNGAAGEDCDNGSDTPGCNGNKNGSDGPGNCKFPACGDGYTNTTFRPPGSTKAEACDTTVDSQTCNGNGNGNVAKNLDAQCQPPQCGDGYVNAMFKPPGADDTENCDNGVDDKTGGVNDTPKCNGNNKGNNGPGSCRIPLCGDGYWNSAFTQQKALAKAEQCDTRVNSQTCNGNDNDNDTAQGLGDCQIPSCGDGYWNSAFTQQRPLAKAEQCDTRVNSQTCNGNDNDNDIAQGLGDCQTPSCGDGYVNMAFVPPGMPPNLPPDLKLSEECDNIRGVDTPDCNGNNGGKNGPGSCRLQRCGDGYLNTKAGEQCDPGDSAHGIPKIPGSCRGNQTCKDNCTCG